MHRRYDSTGRTDESQFADAEAMGWDAYFESLYQKVDRRMLDEDKKRYQGERRLNRRHHESVERADADQGLKRRQPT